MELVFDERHIPVERRCGYRVTPGVVDDMRSGWLLRDMLERFIIRDFMDNGTTPLRSAPLLPADPRPLVRICVEDHDDTNKLVVVYYWAALHPSQDKEFQLRRLCRGLAFVLSEFDKIRKDNGWT